MKTFLLSMIGIALMELLLSSFAGDESMQRAVRLLCGTAMAVLVLSKVIGFDYAGYAAALAKSDSYGLWAPESAEERGHQLNRRLIEDRCRAYILDKAASLDVGLSDAEVTLTWSTDGYWYPTAATLTGIQGQGKREALEQILERDFGIPAEQVMWREAEDP